jgi:hypothetical protein
MSRFPSFDLTAALWCMAGIVTFWSFGYTEMKAGDLWWHVAAGRLLVESGSPWLVDTWSYTANGQAWLNHEWLSDVIFHLWTSVFGLAALAYWKWLVLVAAYLLLQNTLFRICGDRLAAFAGAVLAIAVAAPFLDVRPHLYTILNFCLLLALALERKPSRRILAVLFLVWVNLHAGFFFGLLALGILLAPWREIRVDTIRVAATSFFVAVVASAINPFGIDVFFYPLKYAFETSSPFRGIGEWLGPFEAGGIQAPLYPWVIGVLVIGAGSYALPSVRRNVRIPWEGLMLAGLTLAMSLTSRRFIPLFGISAALVVTPVVAWLFRKFQPPVTAKFVPVLALGIGLLLLLPYPQSPAHAFHYLTAQYSEPVAVVDFIELNELEGPVFAHYSFGGYLHLRTQGRMKVFIDGRADTVYDAETYIQYRDVVGDGPGWQDVVESRGAEYFLWPVSLHNGVQKSRALIATGRWRLLYRDSVAVLLARTDLEFPATMKVSASTGYHSLAVAMLHANRGELEMAEVFFLEAIDRLPYLKPACLSLAQTQAYLGKAAAARARVEMCAALYPGAAGVEEMRALVEKWIRNRQGAAKDPG